MFKGMAQPVHLGEPATTMGIIQLLGEILEGFVIVLLDGQRLLKVRDVVDGLEFWDFGGKHKSKQTDEKISVTVKKKIRLVAQLLKPVTRRQGRIIHFVTSGIKKHHTIQCHLENTYHFDQSNDFKKRSR